MPTQSNQLLISRDVNLTRWLFRAYLLLLFLIPLPLGSNRPIFWSLMVAGIALITLVWVFGVLTGLARWPGAVKRARWVLMPLGLFVGWVGVQVLVGLVGGGSEILQSRPASLIAPTGLTVDFWGYGGFFAFVDWVVLACIVDHRAGAFQAAGLAGIVCAGAGGVVAGYIWQFADAEWGGIHAS